MKTILTLTLLALLISLPTASGFAAPSMNLTPTLGLHPDFGAKPQASHQAPVSLNKKSVQPLQSQGPVAAKLFSKSALPEVSPRTSLSFDPMKDYGNDGHSGSTILLYVLAAVGVIVLIAMIAN